MKLAGLDFSIVQPFDRVITVPDCFVVRSNKIGTGNGEAKLYIGSRELMAAFFGHGDSTFRQVKCFLVKQDLLRYLQAVKTEYFNPTASYQANAEELKKLWETRLSKVQECDEIIEFTIEAQSQLQGNRGYVKSKSNAYQLIRELSLPNITYISVMEVSSPSKSRIFYLRLFVNFEAVAERIPLVYKYGTKRKALENKVEPPKEENKRHRARDGQVKYREKLLEECPFCPITLVNEERLLIASHIKPWAVCDERERVDPKNGYMLSPLYDKLFDRGFITFTNDKRILVSNWLSPQNKMRLRLDEKQTYKWLLMDEARQHYLEYHREFVFMG